MDAKNIENSINSLREGVDFFSKTAGLKPSSGRSWEESGPGPGRTGAELGPSYDRPTSRPKVRPKLTQGGPKPSPKSAQCQPSDVQLLLFFSLRTDFLITCFMVLITF